VFGPGPPPESATSEVRHRAARCRLRPLLHHCAVYAVQMNLMSTSRPSNKHFFLKLHV